ncbi:hypothetical protein A3I36_00330 [Candidatus Giovannonibacteria bacterium RIFCSPLOWO2_02_FULL_45_28]|uniref:Uncharacterized protein n=1 Tax=Candidatus Giovannonibacteria bacterium RIFCSPHIGHO2_02_FULL_45_40 TaxID=1798337 RepID=A0A1F5WAQ3_9BACT|nr:MAG: hypothetical protein A2W40_00700 [Candidatus Giovannonibacteria bacterium RIFCSPHIGHO2_01_45_12]OGF60230.1 MAG: hypothetical protein A2656_03705 [Candidatus Giovannonibacteria bacterium RIFCSPHIGHO2_01_FULL_44_100]OGF72737.1 MAG: hypothetical protein A3C05_03135 [Candidatus Giovannonibacteria bacterium RIFCSPHIGHO2_02_FULL_45_40]OGF83517.1 MAG: hypothetical protein A3E63_05025 [Candidatus Giovannonibacteria bacterium RIFCSPHIGHO2_12_FULL_45_19]OGF84783.1 MAG: hypothetical protein A3A19_
MKKIAKQVFILLTIAGWIFYGLSAGINDARAELYTALFLTAVLAFATLIIVNPPRAYFGRCGALFCYKIRL